MKKILARESWPESCMAEWSVPCRILLYFLYTQYIRCFERNVDCILKKSHPQLQVWF